LGQRGGLFAIAARDLQRHQRDARRLRSWPCLQRGAERCCCFVDPAAAAKQLAANQVGEIPQLEVGCGSAALLEDLESAVELAEPVEESGRTNPRFDCRLRELHRLLVEIED